MKDKEKVINIPRACARVVCSGHTQTGIINNTCLSDHARVRARAIPDEAVAAWRERVFGETMDDPVKVAVEEAVGAFGRKEDFEIWAWYANRIGVSNFANLYFEQLSGMRRRTLVNPAAAFQSRLKRFLAAMQEAEAEKRASKKGGAR